VGLFVRDARGQPFPVVTGRNTVVDVIDFTDPRRASRSGERDAQMTEAENRSFPYRGDWI